MSGFDTVFPADAVEFCPQTGALNVFACGTYKLDQPQDVPLDPQLNEGHSVNQVTSEPRRQKRRGRCILFEVDEENGDSFTALHETHLPAVPDLKWCHRTPSAPPILGVADSEGHITLHQYEIENKQLKQIQSISCAPSHVLCLSLDWANRRIPSTDTGSLIVSLSNGSLAHLRPNGSSGLSITDTWHAHDFEPWIAAWNYWDTNIVYSGGDDLKMKGWDIRQGFSQPTFVNKRFDAGVTTIQSHPHIEHIIAVGSYDNSVRLFDVRKPLTPLTQADVGGGAWRVKWHPSSERKDDLLVACMHDGFKIVRFGVEAISTSTNKSDWEIIQRFDKHESLAYGIDWSYSKDNGKGTLVASCSFYDHLLHLWRG